MMIKRIVKLSRRLIVNKLPPKMKIFIAKILPRKLLNWYSEKSTDIFLISFPKCGRTWLRLMIGKVLQLHFNLVGEEVNILELHKLADLHPCIPRILVTHDDDPHWKRADELDEKKLKYRDAKVIFLVRDPRDVIVSLYFHKKNRDDAYNGTISEFIHEEVGGIDTLIKFYKIWERNRCIPKDFLLVRYEDIHKNPEKELRKILKFIGLEGIRNELIRKAVSFASFENMQRMERENRLGSFRLMPTNKADINSYKTRRGKVGGYVDYLSKDEINFLNRKIGTSLRMYGY